MEHIRLIGKIETQIVSNWANYKLHYQNKIIKIGMSKFNCKDDLFKPYKTNAIKKDYGKISRNNRPYPFHCFMGYIHLDFLGTKKDLNKIMEISQLGKYKNEGMGKIEWKESYVFKENNFDEITIKIPKKISLRKLNLNDIAEQDYPFLTACLIHDLVHIKNKHPNKLWGLPDTLIKDNNVYFIVCNHHNKIKHPLIKRLQEADRKASIIARKKEREIKSSIYNPIRKSYEDKVNSQMFQKIQKEIEDRINNFPKLYEYIWNCKELDYLVEAQNYPETSLRKHLLLTTQFAVG